MEPTEERSRELGKTIIIIRRVIIVILIVMIIMIVIVVIVAVVVIRITTVAVQQIGASREGLGGCRGVPTKS